MLTLLTVGGEIDRSLSEVKALETYDFRRRDPHELPPAEHKKRIRAIRDGAPKEWRHWLGEKLAGSNYHTLDSRIRAVLGECATVTSKIIGALPEDLDNFLTVFKDSRNYYTHYNPKKEDKAASDTAALSTGGATASDYRDVTAAGARLLLRGHRRDLHSR
jgi:ApeA N-terminal domain 1